MTQSLCVAGLVLGVLLAWLCRVRRRQRLADYGHSLCTVHITEADGLGSLLQSKSRGGSEGSMTYGKTNAQGASIQLPAFCIHASSATGAGGQRRSEDESGGAEAALHRSSVSLLQPSDPALQGFRLPDALCCCVNLCKRFPFSSHGPAAAECINVQPQSRMQ